MTRGFTRIAAFAGMLVVMLWAASSAQATTLHCGQTVTQDVSLANNLTGCTGDGIDIGADGLQIRLQGHTITAASNNSGIGINFKGHSHILLIGGAGNRITGFGTSDLYVDGDYNTLRQLLTSGSSSGVWIAGSHNTLSSGVQHGNVDGVDIKCNSSPCPQGYNTVTGDNASNNGTGIRVYYAGDRNVVSYSTINFNDIGIAVEGDASAQPPPLADTTIKYNSLSGDGIVDIDGTQDTFLRNTISGSYIGFGIYGTCTGCTGPEQLISNFADHNQRYGFLLVGCSGGLFESNRAEGNGAAGFMAEGPCGLTLENNYAGGTDGCDGLPSGPDANGIGIEVTGSYAPVSGESVAVTGNRACNNHGGPDGAGGIVVDNLSGNNLSYSIDRNVASSNSGDGIGAAGQANSVSSNTAAYNRGYGINLDTAPLADGGNRAYHNQAGQCVNVTCTS